MEGLEEIRGRPKYVMLESIGCRLEACIRVEESYELVPEKMMLDLEWLSLRPVIK